MTINEVNENSSLNSWWWWMKMICKEREKKIKFFIIVFLFCFFFSFSSSLIHSNFWFLMTNKQMNDSEAIWKKRCQRSKERKKTNEWIDCEWLWKNKNGFLSYQNSFDSYFKIFRFSFFSNLEIELKTLEMVSLGSLF